MFQNAIKLFTIRGFEVRLHFSWLIIATLLTWSLAVGFFPATAPGRSAGLYWGLAAISVVALFLCVILHELAHSLSARRNNLPMKGITLFIFGGVAEMSEEPSSPGAEFRMAIAGPLTSLALAVVFYAGFLIGLHWGWPIEPVAVVYYLAVINGLLAMFNLLPAFPLDGGRVLRSYFWHRRGDRRSATKTAAAVGSGFSFILIMLGLISVFGGNLVGGLWWIVIGMFLNGAATASRQQADVLAALEGKTVEEFSKKNPVTVSPELSVREFVEQYIYRLHLSMFPVLDVRSQLVGCVTTKDVKKIPPGAWERRTVEEIASPCSSENSVQPDLPAEQAVALMNRTNRSRLIVREGARLAGIVTLKDIMAFVAVRLELGDAPSPQSPSGLDKAA